MRSRFFLSSAAYAAAIVALTGCTVGPRYAKPTPPTPQSADFVAESPATTAGQEPPPNWWQLYRSSPIDQLVQQALVHNKTLLQAAANLTQARAAISLARAGLFPSTNLNAGVQYGVTSDEAAIYQLLNRSTPSASALYSVGMDASYEVDIFGRVRRTIEAAKADYEAEQAAMDVVRISVAGETTRAFVNACAYAAELAVAKQSFDIAMQAYDITAKEFRDGASSKLDVVRAEEQVSQVKALLPTYEAQRRVALFQLAVLTGDPPEQISETADHCQAPPKLGTVLPVGDVQALFRRRPDVRQAERQLAGNIARVGVATANLYPTITIGGTVESAATSLSGLGSINNLSYGIGPLLTWAFPNNLAARAQVREAKAVASASYANFEATVLQALQDIETALTNYANELDRNAALTAARGQSQTAYNLAKAQYQSGRSSYLELLTAENDLINTSATLANSDQALASDQVTVFKALGGGWEQAPTVTPLPLTDGRYGSTIEVH